MKWMLFMFFILMWAAQEDAHESLVQQKKGPYCSCIGTKIVLRP